MNARVIAVANQKGGVGKTTTAVNFSASLGAAEKKTLLIDLDPQSNATSGSGLVQETTDRKNVYRVLLSDQKVEEAIHSTEVPNLYVLPAVPDLIGFEVEAIEMDEREYQLKRIVDALRHDFDFILIDCPPSLGLLTVNALAAADSVLIPLQCEYFALEGLSRLTNTIDLVRQSLNQNLEIEGILLTMFDKRNRLAHQVAEEVMSHFKEKVFRYRIPRNVRLSEAPSFGKPIILYDIRSAGAQSYLNFTNEFLGSRQYLNADNPRHEIADKNEIPGSRETKNEPLVSGQTVS